MAKGKVFDMNLFKRLLTFIRPYRTIFFASLFVVVGLAIFGALRPYVLQQAIDVKISQKQYNGFLALCW